MRREEDISFVCLQVVVESLYDEYITSDHIKELRAKMYGDK